MIDFTIDEKILARTIKLARERKILIPTLKQQIDPQSLPSGIMNGLADISLWDLHPLNLFRITWHNEPRIRGGKFGPVNYLEFPSELTGVQARIAAPVGKWFPTGAHKVGAAFGCLVPRLVTGQFDPGSQRAVWPSTGNYCRGGVAVSRILGVRGVAVLPEGMSKERFAWLEKWVEDKNDIIKTTGTESNVKEIYDACNELAKDPNNEIINQFSEYYNYAIHRAVTGPSLERSFIKVKGDSNLKARFYVSASGSSGTLAAGDYLKERLLSKIAVVEATECPTLLYGGYGEHNIQGIGDKHVPLIHNVMNTDFVVGVSDQATNYLNLIFNTEIGQKYLIEKKGLEDKLVKSFPEFGFSSIANILASIKLAKYMNLGSEDAILQLQLMERIYIQQN